MSKDQKFVHIAYLLLLGMCWGPSFLFIKVALRGFEPLTLVALRLFLGALFLFSILIIKNISLKPYYRLWKEFFIMGLFSAALPFTLITHAEVYISSALTSILNSTTPIFTAILAVFFLRNETLNKEKFVGISLGVSGVIAIFLPAALDAKEGNAFGVILVLIAAASYAAGMIYAKRKLAGLPAMVAPCLQLFLVSIIWLPLALANETPHLQRLPGLDAILAVFGLAIFGTGIAFMIYFKLIREAGATFVATGTLFFPVIGVALGYVFLGEALSINAIIGTLMILSGLILFNGLIFRQKTESQTS